MKTSRKKNETNGKQIHQIRRTSETDPLHQVSYKPNNANAY